jgi:SAM-dependent methyltransferase
VLAVDSSAGMLARAKAKAPEPGAGTISWLEADATAMTLPIESFDRAYCQQGLQFMPNPTEAMKRVLKALKPGGHFTCAVWSPATEKSNVIMYHLGQALMDVGRARWFDVAVKPMSWSTTTDGAGYTKLEDALIAAGFTNPDVCVEDGVFEFADMDTAVAIAKVGPYGAELVEDIELWDAFAENFANRLRPYVQPDGRVVTPARSYVGHGVAPWN